MSETMTVKEVLTYHKYEIARCFNDHEGCSESFPYSEITPEDFLLVGTKVINCNESSTHDDCNYKVTHNKTNKYEYTTQKTYEGENNMFGNMMNEIGLTDFGFGWIFIILGFLWLTTSIKFVSEKTARVYTWFGGKYANTLQAGFNLIPPFPIYTHYRTVGLEMFKSENIVEVKSEDNAFLKIKVNLQLRIIKGKEKESVFELENPEEQIFDYVYNSIVNVANGKSMNDIFQSKDDFETAIEKLKEEFEEFGYKIVKVLIEDPKVSDKLSASFEDVLASKRRQEAAVYNAKAEKIELVGTAEAKSAALELTAKGIANARAIIADSNANNIEVMLGRKTMKSEMVEQKVIGENGEETTIQVEKITYQDVENPKDIGITAKDALNFLDRINEIEGWKEASRGEGSIIITGNNSSNNLESQVAALTKALENKNQNK